MGGVQGLQYRPQSSRALIKDTHEMELPIWRKSRLNMVSREASGAKFKERGVYRRAIQGPEEGSFTAIYQAYKAHVRLPLGNS